MQFEEFLNGFSEVIEEADGWVVLCPAHHDSRPSLRITIGSTGKVLLKCRAGCANGSVLSALGMEHYPEPPEGHVAKRTRSEDAEPSTAEIAALRMRLDGYGTALTDGSPQAQAALDYAWERFGISQDDAGRLGLGLATDLGGGPRLVVPFADSKGVYKGYQARALDSASKVRWLGPKNPDGASWSKVGFMPGVSGFDEVVVTEGPGDALTACATGYDSIAVRGAGLASNAHVAEAIINLVGTSRPIVVFGDDDPSGEKFAHNLVSALARAGVEKAAVGRVKVANDLTAWRESNPTGFTTDFQNAVHLALSGSSHVTALLAEFDIDLGDVDLAERLLYRIRELGDDVRFTPEAGFFILDGGVWRHDTLNSVRTQAQQLSHDISKAVRKAERLHDPDSSVEAALIAKGKAKAKRAGSSKAIDYALRELQALPGVATSFDDFDTHHDLLAFRNGVVNLRTGELLPHDPSLLMTRRVEFDYDAEARSARWEAFLNEVFPGEPDLPAFMQRLVGYGITGRTDEQCFVVHWGTGSNGKSVFIDTLTKLFRDITTTTPFSTFEQKPSGGIPNDIAALKGARLVMASEGEAGKTMAEAIIKRVTGKDSISARFMRKEFFEFTPTFLLMLATNNKPSFRGQDEGLWRRVKLVSWERYFAPHERDHYLQDKLLAEAEGILAWAVAGAVEWYARGLQDPEAITGATKEYRETSDLLAGFIPGVYVADSDEHRLAGPPLYREYDAWCMDEGVSREKLSRRRFYEALEERGFVRYMRDGSPAFMGIRKATAADHEQGEQPLRTTEVEEAPLAQGGVITSPVALLEREPVGLVIPLSAPSLDDL